MQSKARPDSYAEQLLTPIPGTPNPSMSHSRSGSPHEDGGWSNPGLSIQYGDTSGRSSPANGVRQANGGQGWEGPRKKAVLNGGAYPTEKTGFFKKHYRAISESLPSFSRMSEEDKIGFKEKPAKSRMCLPSRNSRLGRRINDVADFCQRRKKPVLAFLTFILLWILFYTTRKFCYLLRRSARANKDSYRLLLAQSTIARWRKEVCPDISCQPRRRCHGVEGTERVGD